MLTALALALALLQAPDSANTSHPAPDMPDTVAARPARLSRQDSILEERTKAVASQLRCPVCQGLSIQDSPSELAREMKDLVRDQLRAGKSDDEVKDYFVSKYGTWILLQPPAEGFNLAVYLLPVVALIGGIILIVVLTRRWTARAGTSPPVETPEEEPTEVG